MQWRGWSANAVAVGATQPPNHVGLRRGRHGRWQAHHGRAHQGGHPRHRGVPRHPRRDWCPRQRAERQGTEEHRLRDAGVVGGGTGMAGHGTHGVGQPTMTERVKESIPGTREYEATHGMTGAHSSAQQAKAHIPGTDEHRVATSMEPGYGTGAGGLTGAGAGGLTGAGAGAHHPHTAGTHAGGQELGSGPLGMGTAGIGSGQERMGAAATGEQREGLGHKVMKHIPGTREHEEKKLAEGRI